MIIGINLHRVARAPAIVDGLDQCFYGFPGNVPNLLNQDDIITFNNLP